MGSQEDKSFEPQERKRSLGQTQRPRAEWQRGHPVWEGKAAGWQTLGQDFPRVSVGTAVLIEHPGFHSAIWGLVPTCSLAGAPLKSRLPPTPTRATGAMLRLGGRSWLLLSNQRLYTWRAWEGPGRQGAGEGAEWTELKPPSPTVLTPVAQEGCTCHPVSVLSLGVYACCPSPGC